jgi:hypothetical protein
MNLPPGTFTETITVLEILRAAFQDPIPGICSTLSFEDFVSALLHWKEATTTSPSGRHLGLYKSLVTAHCDSGSEFPKISPPKLKLLLSYRRFTHWTPQ